MKKIYLIGLSLLMSAGWNLSFAQLNYPVTNALNTTTTYTDLGTSGSVITVANNDDANSAPQPIGFTFQFNGQNFTDFILNTNGFIKLGTVAPSSPSLSYTGVLPNLLGPIESTDPLDVNLIAGFCHDLEAGTGGAEYRVATTGSAPNRVTTIQYKGVQDKAGQNPNNAAAPVQYSNIQFQIRLFETSNNIEVVFGPWTATANASQFKAAASGIKGSSFSSGNFVSTQKVSSGAFSLTTFTSTAPLTGNRFNFGNPPTRPAPDAGRTFRYVPTVANDIAVRTIWSFGRYPLGGIQPPQINRVVIRNNGTATQSNIPVTLTVSGVNSFTQTVAIPSLAPGVDTIVAFSAYTPTVAGTDSITVSVPADQNPGNNSRFILQIVNNNGDFGYADSLTGISNNVGGALAMIGAIRVAGSRAPAFNVFSVSDVSMIINNDATLVGRVLRPVVCDVNGSILGTGPDFTIQSTDLGQRVFMPFTSPVSVLDTTFFAGVLKPDATSFFPYTTQAEAPVRSDLTYAFIPATGGAPSNFSGTTNFGRLTIGVRYTQANASADLSVPEVFGIGRVALGFNTDSVQMFARLRNLIGGATPVTLSINITGANPRTLSTTVTANAGANLVVPIPAYKPTNLGFDTIRVTIPADGNNGNNEAVFIQEVTATRTHYHAIGQAPSNAVGFNTINAINDEQFLNGWVLNDTAPAVVTKVRVSLGATGINGITMRGLVKTATGDIAGESDPVVLTTADANTVREFIIIPRFGVPAFQPGETIFAGVSFSKDAGSPAAFPIGFNVEDPNRPGGVPAFRAAGASAPTQGTSPWIYHLDVDLVNANTPNTISAFNLLTPADSTVVFLNGPGSTPFVATWSAAVDTNAVSPITYTFLLDLPGLANPSAFESDNGGLSPSLTLTYEELDAFIDQLGIPIGTSFDFQWSVVASSVPNSRVANDTFNLTIDRGTVTFNLCTPNATDNTNDFIQRFQMTGRTDTVTNLPTQIDDNTGRNTPNQYRDAFGTTEVLAERGANYPFTITMGIGGPGNTLVGSFSYVGGVAVDWNQNNFFGLDERVDITTPVQGDTVTFTPAVLNGTLSIPSTASDGQYRMRVYAGDVSATVTPCEVTFGDVNDYKLTIGGTLGSPSVELFKNDVMLFPNPAKDNVRITYTYDKPTMVTLNVFNALGASVIQEQYSNLLDGQIDLSLSGITPGIYYVHMVSEGVTRINKLVIE